MALKAMVFVDGAWLYKSRSTVFAKLGEENFEVDYARLPRLLCEELANAIDEDVSLVRTLYFGTIPSARSSFNTGKQRAFYDFLEGSCHYETHIHEVEVGYGENSLADEAWVSMSLASSMLYYAAIPSVYDVALLVSDNLVYAPPLYTVRKLGKRTQVVSLHTPEGAEQPSGTTLVGRSRVMDFAPIYIDDHAAEMKLVRELRNRICKQCGREEETTWAGADFFCSECRGKHNRRD
ncbi:MAG: NYN domain-containing protein [Kiritimatiellae bacterium]|nr:NYN domain-containing protein [Kiritimatiellia bacterium]